MRTAETATTKETNIMIEILAQAAAPAGVTGQLALVGAAFDDADRTQQLLIVELQHVEVDVPGAGWP